MPFPLYSQGEGGDHVCMSPHPTLMIILISTVPHRRPWFYSWVGKTPWRRDRLPTPVSLGFPCGSAGKESACNAGDLGLVPGLGRSPGGGHGNPLHYSCLENPHGQRSLGGYSPWGCKDSDRTEQLNTDLRDPQLTQHSMVKSSKHFI